ncbi:hypothetical protein L3081_09450 [Colwellia sp. MSW7]|uniref:Uncharacterized protein n=1 Tax=Colwellia maritima TaxID=2912588 RepID=A0ABS9X284_9GAMM|nr:hypothetical protein [Colwellia maritima]MCI2283571.1 hypothetical protein [Colwellia maritima]
MIINEGGNVAHYSSLNNLANILHDKQLRLGSIKNLDDPRESSCDWVSDIGHGSGESENEIKSRREAHEIKETLEIN